MKKVFGFLLVVVVCVLVWFAFALWTGMYSVYSYPPTEKTDGSTLIVSRDEDEPMFNSPDYKPPKKEKPSGGMFGFEKMPKPKVPIAERTIIRLPYIEWAYRRSLEPQDK